MDINIGDTRYKAFIGMGCNGKYYLHIVGVMLIGTHPVSGDAMTKVIYSQEFIVDKKGEFVMLDISSSDKYTYSNSIDMEYSSLKHNWKFISHNQAFNNAYKQLTDFIDAFQKKETEKLGL